MKYLPDTVRSKLRNVFMAADFDKDEIGQHMEEFEKELFGRFTAKAMQKLPEQDREEIAKLANSAAEGKNEQALKDKLTYWLNEKEVEEMWVKVTQELLTELARNLHSSASVEQKKRLEELFKPEVLKG